MPIFKNKVDAGSQFDGAIGDPDGSTSGGFFDPGTNGFTGAPNIETFCDVSFNCAGTATLFELRVVDPENSSNSTLIYGGALIGAVNTFTRDNVRIPTTSDADRKGLSWHLVLTTTAMDGDGYMNINYDFGATPG